MRRSAGIWGSNKTSKFQSSIRGFSFCGTDDEKQIVVMAEAANFNPLYEALVFAAIEQTSIDREKPSIYFNPLYEALVFAA